MIYVSLKPKKKKQKYASAEHKKKELEAQAIQQKMYKDWGIKDTKVSKSKTEYKMNTSYRGSDQTVNSVTFTGGICKKKEDKKYTGTLIVGVSQMHKSNAVPVIDEQHIKDIARMRR